MRNFTKTLAVVSLLAPASAQPLGIGDLKLHSALNQRLNAEINLILSPDEKPSDIRVRLAAPEKFDEAGIPWSYFLSKIKFDTLVKTNGAVVVKLSSNDALQEPFLDFLVEVSWTNGSMYREFTVLVDPPTAYQQPIIPVIEKTQPVQTVQSFPPARTTTKRVSMAPGGFQGDSYGPTVRNDTLWEIAEKVKPSSRVSTEQMMMALYEKNPDAFYKANVNALMEGTTLKIPDNNVIAKLSKKQAARLFSQQVNNWNAVKSGQPLNDASALVASESENKPINNQLKLIAPLETNVSENAIVSPGQGQGDAAVNAATSSVPGGETHGTDEAVLQGRIQQLESRVEELQKMLVLKDEQLALLQNKATVQPSIVNKPQAQAKSEKIPEEQQAVDVKQPVADKKQKGLEIIKETQQANSDGFGGYYAIIGGLGVMILGGLGYLWWRKREIQEEDYDTESMFNSSSEIRLPDTDVSLMTTAEEASNYDVGTVGESSFLSEFTPSDFDAFDSDQNEVDPISEADVYLAYGRYQQAEELIRQTIVDNPQRQDCKLKLLEIFYANENKVAFEDYVNELVQEDMHSDSEFWSKVVELGKEIIPDSALLSTVSKSDDHEESGSANFDLSEDDAPASVNIDESGEKDPIAQFDSDLEEITNEDLDFNMDEIFADNSDPSDPSPESSEKLSENSVEFDLDGIAESLDQDHNEMSNDKNEEEIESLEFDSGTDVEKQAIESTMDVEMDFDPSPSETDEIVQNIDISEAAKKDDQLESAQSDVGDFDFSFDLDLDKSSLKDKDSEGSIEKNAVSDITDMDEFETKIDLVKAYIDMGDAEAAKSIAEEVLKNGNNHQKQAAQSILDQIN